MQITNVKIGLIKPYKKNAKKHPAKQIKQVADSIREFGFCQPLVVDSDNVLIVGHGRLQAAQSLGLEFVPVVVADLTEQQAKAYRLADNKLNESDWDMELVMDEIAELDLRLAELTGFGELLETEDAFSLADGDKQPFEQMTFSLSSEQAATVRQAIAHIMKTDQYKYAETNGNKNKNGNALAVICEMYANS